MTNARRVGLALALLPFLATVMVPVFGWWPGLVDLALCLAMYAATMLGITAGFHRCATHGSFKAHPALRATLLVLGSMAGQGPVLFWAAVHRRHHQHSDLAGDPHSPQAQGPWHRRLAGFWHGHAGWLGGADASQWRAYIPDLLKDPLVLAVHRGYLIWVLLGLALPAIAGGLSAGSWQAAWSAALWGGLVRLFLAHQATWSVNSVCHLHGERPFRTGDRSANNAICALLTLGEGWHNNHHAFPASVRHGLEWWQLDFTYLAIAAFARLGLAAHLVLPGADTMTARRWPTAEHEVKA